jgi:hypothetical protein
MVRTTAQSNLFDSARLCLFPVQASALHEVPPPGTSVERRRPNLHGHTPEWIPLRIQGTRANPIGRAATCSYSVTPAKTATEGTSSIRFWVLYSESHQLLELRQYAKTFYSLVFTSPRQMWARCRTSSKSSRISLT